MAMRYWHPFAEECLDDVVAYAPDEIILLPLYPQFSTTTTESFLRVWQSLVDQRDIKTPTTSICCYPKEDGFVKSVAVLTRASIEEAGGLPANPKLLFSAHGIPKKFVETGDPYQSHVEMTVEAIVKDLAIKDLDYMICYQSRVGPVEWLKPYTDHVITEYAAQGRPIVLVPVAFVSEHSETLVELDIEYKEITEADVQPTLSRPNGIATISISDLNECRAIMKKIMPSRISTKTLSSPDRFPIFKLFRKFLYLIN